MGTRLVYEAYLYFSGEFGVIYKAYMKSHKNISQLVAVKTLKGMQCSVFFSIMLVTFDRGFCHVK